MSASAKRPFSRDQRTTIVYGMLVFVLIRRAAALAADRDDERVARRRRCVVWPAAAPALGAWY